MTEKKFTEDKKEWLLLGWCREWATSHPQWGEGGDKGSVCKRGSCGDEDDDDG